MTERQQLEGFLERLGEAFDEARNPQGLMRRIAARCDVTQQAVGRWRRTGNVAREHLGALADELGVTTDWLLTGGGQKRTSERDRACGFAPIVGDTFGGVVPERIGVTPSRGDPVVPVGYRGEAPIYAVRAVEAASHGPRYQTGEVVLALHRARLIAGFDVFVQWMAADGIHAGIRRLAWHFEGEIALDPVVPVEGMGRRIHLVDELGICDPIYAVVPPWVVELSGSG